MSESSAVTVLKTIVGTAAAAKLLQSCPTLCNPMDYVAHQVPLIMGFSRQLQQIITNLKGIKFWCITPTSNILKKSYLIDVARRPFDTSWDPPVAGHLLSDKS